MMLNFSFWLTFIVFAGVFGISILTAKIAGNSGKYFMLQQKTLGQLEGYVEEMMHGAKVVKVFCHEEETKQAFDELNEQLRKDVTKANSFGNILGPIMGNIGNIMYVLLAVVGTILYLTEAPNLSLTGIAALGIGNAVAFLQMSRQFTQNVNSASMQINSIVMGLAGAERVYNLLDEESEFDEGYVTLVNAVEVDGKLQPSEKRTGRWAWKHTHKSDGSTDYVEVKGHVVFDGVDFGYTDEKMVLHDVKLYAEPGQKIAFVGSTGAGKTTITNLINRIKFFFSPLSINPNIKFLMKKSIKHRSCICTHIQYFFYFLLGNYFFFV